MVKELKSFRLEKDISNYLDTEVKKGKFKSKAQAVAFMISYYKQEQGLILELPNQFNQLLLDLYNKAVPFFFGILFTWFMLHSQWVFLPFLAVALFPFVFKAELKENAVKVSI